MVSKSEVGALIILVLSTVSNISADPTCFPTCQETRFDLCVPTNEMNKESKYFHSVNLHIRTMCISCSDGHNEPAENTTSPPGKCFLHVQWLALKGFKFGKLSSQKLALIDPSSLNSLILIDAGITEIGPATFVQFLWLQNLNLDDNELTHIPRNWHGASYPPNIYIIKTISISGNKISSLAPACFQNLHMLLSLDLGGNVLREVHSKWFIGLEGLHRLFLSKNKIETIPLGAFQYLKQLQLLDISDNDLVCLSSKVFFNLPTLSRFKLSGNNFGFSKVNTVGWKLVMDNCPSVHMCLHCGRFNALTHLSRSKQWMRFEAIGIILHINRLVNNKFTIDWSGTLASKHTVPSDIDHCNPLSEAFRSGHFERFSPFVIIGRKSKPWVRKSVLTECSEAWAASGGMALALQGQSSLRISRRSDGFSLVVKTQKNHTFHSRTVGKDGIGVRQHSDHESYVACFALVPDHKDVITSFFNVSTTNQVDDRTCLLQEHVSTVETGVVIMNISGTSTNVSVGSAFSSNVTTIPQTQNMTVRPVTTCAPLFSLKQTDTTSKVVGSPVSKTHRPLMVISTLSGLVIIMGSIALFCYNKRRTNNQNLENDRPNRSTSFSNDDIRRALQMNPMYRGSRQVTSQSGSMQDSCQTDGDGYDQINEEEVYVPSGHDYCQIKDEDDSAESKPVPNTPSAHEPNKIDGEDIDDASGHVSQTENSKYGHSLTSATAAVASTGNVVAGISIYKADTKTEASVNRSLANSVVRKSVGQEQTAYEMTDCTLRTLNRTDR